MRCADSSVLVPAFATWHEHHEAAEAALRDLVVAVGHCVAETYSVLTRLPEPLRMPPTVAAEVLDAAIERVLVLDGPTTRRLPAVLVASNIAGGATYDGLIALTAINHSATLVTMDQRAMGTYQRLGADYELVFT